jgi:hypothetical protein
VLDFIKNCLDFLFSKELKIKRIIIEKLEKMQPSLKTKKKKKRMDCRSHVGVTLPSSIVNKGRPAKMILIATRKATI